MQVDDYTIEHIMPQNENLSAEWRHDLGNDWQSVQERYLHTIGNLSLTGYYSELSDDSVALGMHVNKAIKSGFSTARIIQINPQKLWNISTEKILIDINIADTLLLKSLSGIGPVLSKRIVEYRGKLGGFLNKEQLKEIYGFRIETYDKIKNKIEVLDSTIIRININTVSIEAFKNHPYINWNLANSIVNYREQHGQYTSIEKIKSIHLVVDEIYRKIAPYLRID